MTAYYNEFDPKAAAWLRELIKQGLIAPGDVDERSIVDVRAADLLGYTQHHFFAGIGGWSLALRLAGWPDDRPVWTGSCPCQPFSLAGKGLGYDDERHLAPIFLGLVRECHPAAVFGEQVASAAGRIWLADLRLEMEALGYAVGAADLCAAGVGSPHIRQRLWFGAHRLADAGRPGLEGCDARAVGDERPPAERGGRALGVAHTSQLRCQGIGGGGTEEGPRAAERGCACRLAHPDSPGCGIVEERHGEPLAGGQAGEPGADRAGRGEHGRVADAAKPGRDEQPERHDRADGRPTEEPGRLCATGSRPGPVNGFWRDADWLHCRDAKWRPVEPGTFPLAHGLPARVGRLRGYGNAIVPQVGAAFVASFVEALAW